MTINVHLVLTLRVQAALLILPRAFTVSCLIQPMDNHSFTFALACSVKVMKLRIKLSTSEGKKNTWDN